MGVFTLNNNFVSVDELMKNDMLREYFSTEPKKVTPESTSYFYYCDTLFRKAMSIYQLKNAPDNWDIDYFMSVLLSMGFIAVTNTALGVLPLKCGLSGVNVFNHFTTVIIANPILGNLERTIDEDATVIKMQYSYAGIIPIVQKYASMLAQCDSSISVNLMNSKVTFIGLVENKQTALTMREMYSQISSGVPAVFVKGSQINGDSILYNHVKENFVAGDIQILKRKIMSEFLTEIGINNCNYEKKERLTDNEVEANDSEIQLNSGYWFDNINEGINKTNKMFNLNLKFELKNNFYEGDEDNDNTVSVI